MRNHFDEQLEELNQELSAMGALCEEAISAAIQALLTDEREMAEKAIAVDSRIDEKEREIENLCMRLLLQQQPVARDLRVISSALKMISDMERIGDQASDIAEITEYVQNSSVKNQVHIRNMTVAVIKMVTDSIDSFVKKDKVLALSVIDYDDVVDRLFDEVKHELIALISEGSANGESCIDLLMVAKYLERIGDHATNIAEWVLYSLTGHRGEAEL